MRGTRTHETIGDMRHIAFVLLAACNSSNPQARADDSLARVKTGPYLDVTPFELNIAYLRNSVAADQAYKGKVLRVRGHLDRVGQNANGLPIVLLSDLRGNEKTTQTDAIQCAWGEDKALVAKLEPGSVVTLGGVGAGTVLDRPLLASCAQLPGATSNDVAEALAERPVVDVAWWKRNLETFIEGKDVAKYSIDYKDTGSGATNVVITTNKCDRARLAVEQLGAMPTGFAVECVASAKGDAAVVQWRLPEK